MNKKSLILLIYILTIILVIGCNPRSKERDGKSEENIKISVEILNHEIVNYLNAIESESMNQSSLFEEYVLEPIREKYLKDNQGIFLAEQHIKDSLKDSSIMLEALVALENQNLQKKISDIIKNCNDYLKIDEVTVLVIPITSKKTFGQVDFEASITGLAYGEGKILLMIDPFAEKYEELLPNILAHEYHHSVWLTQEQFGSGFTLLDYLVFEGRAVFFANKVYPTIENTTVSMLGDIEARELFNRISKNFNSTNKDYLTEVMFGSSKFPIMGGYSLGHIIVENYIEKNPNLDIVDWTFMSPKDILNEMDYETN